VSIGDRLLGRPERATGTRAAQVVERYRCAECRLERDTLKDALESLLSLASTAGPCGVPQRYLDDARGILRWAEMREQAREISTREGLG
jgi:hypothetical protein